MENVVEKYDKFYVSLQVQVCFY